MQVHHPIHHAFFFFFIILLLSFPNYSESLTTHEDDERAILLILKQHWVYPFSLFEQWNSTSSPCDWPGISCNFNRSVTRISLSGMYTGGSFPDYSTILCHLNNLVSINFSSNNLWGTIPANLSSCSKLETLDLSTNDLTGEIAGELFSMKTLRSLNLGHNMLSGEIPKPMVAYSLESLDLSYNLLNGPIPKDIGNLYNLTYLDLSGNCLSDPIPAGLLRLHQLSYLSLASNNLIGEIPSQLFSMKKLGSLNLGQNMLSGEIPTPKVVYNLLEYLNLSSNHLNGAIPDDIGNLYNLGYLDLSMNSLSGQIPATLLHLQQLSHLSLSFNNLTGKIPSQLFSLKKLRSLRLSQNKFSGEIPAPKVPHSLEDLDLSSNQLSGSIPGELFSMKWLRRLYLQYNMLSGEIPTPIVAHNLMDLDLSSNQLNGSILDDIGNLYILGYLKLSNNSLSGPIPARLSQLQHLSQLSLSYNKLSGEIPTSWVSYSLEDLDLSSNHLNGSIQEDIWSSYNLIRLDLSNNSLKGPIPVVLLQLPQLSHLSLSYNKLIGEIPAGLFAIPSLSSIDLSHNHLSGTIAKGFGELLQLRARTTLAICFNNISGRIPYKLVKERFIHSCFDEANLCSDVKEKGLPACSTDWCSDDTIRGYMDCSSKSKKKSNYIIITCGAIAGIILIGLGILIMVFRPRVGRRKESDGEEWSMISFQRLEFNKWDILGGLTDENLIGNGGSGKVYRVITKKDNRVAVKSIWHEQKQGQGLMEKQFLAEVKILGRIWHNNIVKLLCCIRGKTTKLLVYEYMDKQCVHKWLHGKKRGLTTQVLQWETRLKIAMGAAQGLCYLHHNCSPPIVHRDIKSSNILVDSDFNAKIADFGLAKIMASEGDPETASAIVGTFGYIAPEHGSTRKVDAKCDIYSFGVVLLELTTGREAVTRNEDVNLAQWAHKHLREGNSAADALDEEIKDPRYLEAMIAVFKLGLACTLSSPSSRPSMKDISQILQRCSVNNHMSPES